MKSFIEASLLGDGCIKRPKINGLYRLTQVSRHTDYVMWVKELLDQHTTTRLYYYEKRADGKNAAPWYILETIVNPLFTELYSKWYPEKKKIVPKDLILTPQSLAVWIMDDGSYNKPRKEYKMCTNAFTFEDVDFLKDVLYRDLNLKSSVRKDRNQPVLYILRPSTRDVPEIVKNYIFPSFRYKIYPEVIEVGDKKPLR